MPVKQPNVKHRYTGLDRDQVAKYTVKYKDVFSMKYLYYLMRVWLIEEGWVTREDEEFPEAHYVQRDTPAGKELWVRWRPMKDPPGMKYGFWKFAMDVDMHILGLKETAMVWKGQKVEADKGEVEIVVTANLLFDYSKAWEKSPWGPFKKLWINRIEKRTKTMLRNMLIQESYRFRDAMATYLKLETFLPEREGAEFWAKRTLE
jgi:hypothetical protein